MSTYLELSAEKRVAVENGFLELFNDDMGFSVDSDVYDIMRGLEEQDRVPTDWFRKNHENIERWRKEQREIGFTE